MQTLAPDNYEIIVVNDGSTDNSHSVITETIAGKRRINYHLHDINLGIGAALRTGYALAKNENVCAIPGDCQYDVKELLQCPDFTAKEYVSFYRARTRYNLYRKVLNQANRFFNWVTLGLTMHDVNWIKVYKRSQLDSIEMNIQSSLVESEICAKLTAQGIKCIEIESKYLERLHDASKGGSFKTVLLALSDMYALFKEVYQYKKKLK